MSQGQEEPNLACWYDNYQNNSNNKVSLESKGDFISY